MRATASCRRRHDRRNLPEDDRHVVEFMWPGPGGHECRMALNDISPAGMSFVLEHELPGLELCSTIEGLKIRVGEATIRGDAIVIHITSNPGRPAVCGVLVYPASDEDLVTLKSVLA